MKGFTGCFSGLYFTGGFWLYRNPHTELIKCIKDRFYIWFTLTGKAFIKSLAAHTHFFRHAIDTSCTNYITYRANKSGRVVFIKSSLKISRYGFFVVKIIKYVPSSYFFLRHFSSPLLVFSLF